MQFSFLVACIMAAGGACLSTAELGPERDNRHAILVQDRYDPCTDGRVSDGRPRSCEELRRALRHDRWRGWPNEEYSHARRPSINPCTDGRFSDGRPRSCRELLDWLDSQ